MADGFDVTPAALIAHAAAVDDGAATVEAGGRAGTAVQLGPDAYGQLCQVLPVLLHPLQDKVIAAMSDAAAALHDNAAALREAAEWYQAFDQDAADQLDEVGP